MPAVPNAVDRQVFRAAGARAFGSLALQRKFKNRLQRLTPFVAIASSPGVAGHTGTRTVNFFFLRSLCYSPFQARKCARRIKSVIGDTSKIGVRRHMKLLDLTLATPAANLAWDASLNWRKWVTAGKFGFWRNSGDFVVVGYANKVEPGQGRGVHRPERFEFFAVPVAERFTGDRGCLNYTLILQITKNPPLASISRANRFIMEQNRAAIESEVRRRTPDAAIVVQGHTDLTLVTRHPSPATPRKFSGNSQRRQQRFLRFMHLSAELRAPAGQ